MNARGGKQPTPVPVSPAVLERVAAVVEVLVGKKSSRAAARSLGLSKSQFRKLLHSSVTALANAIDERPRGGQDAMQTEIQKLLRENAELVDQIESTNRLLEAAGDLIGGRKNAASGPRNP